MTTTPETRANSWSPIKKAIWAVLMDENLNDGHYISAHPLADKLVDAVLAATPAAPAPELDADRAWQELCDKDDRTSPVEYPDHALITRDELAAFMRVAPVPVPVGPPWMFDRYVNGVLMAEDVQVDDKTTVEAAVQAAVRIANRGPRGSTLALVLRNPPAPVAASAVDDAEWKHYASYAFGSDAESAAGTLRASGQKARVSITDGGAHVVQVQSCGSPSPNPVADNPAGETIVNAPRVRELEFKPRNRAPNDLLAHSTVGRYDVGIVRGGFTAVRRDGEGDHVLIEGATEVAAIAACNADASSRVLACLEPRAGDGWRAMDSAPRDGSEILLTDGQTVGSGFWSDAQEAKRAEAGWFWESDRDNLLIAKNAHGVTRWSPMPPPPAAEVNDD